MRELSEKITNIVIDYENEIVLINGKKVKEPLKIVITEDDGWDVMKIVNKPKDANVLPSSIPIISIDVKEVVKRNKEKQLRKIVREECSEIMRALKEEIRLAK